MTSELGRRPRVVLMYPLPDSSGEQLLRSEAEVVVPANDGEGAIHEALVGAAAIIIRGPARLTGTHISQAPSLRVIGAVGAGIDNIDVDAAADRGIPVVHGAGVAPRAVAEFVVGAIVAAHRNFPALDRAVREGGFEWSTRLARFRSMELTGSTIGVVGYGNIGRMVAHVVSATFDARVLAYDPLVDSASLPGPATMIGDLGTLLDASQTVTVHVPLTRETRGLLGLDELRRIGGDGILVNTSRGGIVDEGALATVLRSGELKAAVLDVFENEPPVRSQIDRLASVPNLLLSPHVAGMTDLAFRALSMSVVRGVLDALGGNRPSSVSSPPVSGAPH